MAEVAKAQSDLAAAHPRLRQLPGAIGGDLARLLDTYPRCSMDDVGDPPAMMTGEMLDFQLLQLAGRLVEVDLAFPGAARGRYVAQVEAWSGAVPPRLRFSAKDTATATDVGALVYSGPPVFIAVPDPDTQVFEIVAISTAYRRRLRELKSEKEEEAKTSLLLREQLRQISLTDIASAAAIFVERLDSRTNTLVAEASFAIYSAASMTSGVREFRCPLRLFATSSQMLVEGF